jgi:hypothetical protein
MASAALRIDRVLGGFLRWEVGNLRSCVRVFGVNVCDVCVHDRSSDCPDCIKELVSKLDSLEDGLKKREADIEALKNAHDADEAERRQDEEVEQQRAEEAADALRAREDEMQEAQEDMRKVNFAWSAWFDFCCFVLAFVHLGVIDVLPTLPFYCLAVFDDSVAPRVARRLTN